MSTHAAIIIKEPNGQSKGIYCHFDGYPEHFKPILLKHYKSPEKVKELISLGDLSSLDKNIGEKQKFDSPTEDSCVAYHRDRDEDLVIAGPFSSWKTVAQNIDHSGHIYVYKVAEETWFYTKDIDVKLIPLKDVKEC